MPTTPTISGLWAADFGMPRPLNGLEVIVSASALGFYYLVTLWRGPATITDTDGNAFTALKIQGNLGVHGRFYAGPLTDKHIRLDGGDYSAGVGHRVGPVVDPTPLDQVSGASYAAAVSGTLAFTPITPTGVPFLGLAFAGSEATWTGWTFFTPNRPTLTMRVLGSDIANQGIDQRDAYTLTRPQFQDAFYDKNGSKIFALTVASRGFGGPLGDGTPPWVLGDTLDADLLVSTNVARDFDLILLNILGEGASGSGGGGDPNAGAGTGPWCWADRDGAFHIAKASASGIEYRRTDFFTGGVVLTAAVTALVYMMEKDGLESRPLG